MMVSVSPVGSPETKSRSPSPDNSHSASTSSPSPSKKGRSSVVSKSEMSDRGAAVSPGVVSRSTATGGLGGTTGSDGAAATASPGVSASCEAENSGGDGGRPSGPSRREGGVGELTASQQRQMRNALRIQSFLLVSMTALLILEQVYFRGTWGRECDYNLKVWCTVWVARYIAYYVTLIVMTKLVSERRSATRAYRWLTYVKFFLHAFNFAWLGYGIRVILVDDRCDSTTGTWGLVLWWIEFIVTLGPFICFCLLLPVLFWHISRNTPAGEEFTENPTPSHVRDQLTVVKYAEVQSYHEEQQTPSLGLPAVLGPGGGAGGTGLDGGEPLAQIGSLSMAVTGVSLPDVSHQFRRLQSGLLQGSASRPQQHFDGVPSAVTAVANPPSASVLGKSKVSVPCPVCFCDFESDEMIFQLPCDRRHIFHKDCLSAWLDKSQQCPVCRRNIVESLKASQQSTNDEARTSAGDEVLSNGGTDTTENTTATTSVNNSMNSSGNRNASTVIEVGRSDARSIRTSGQNNSISTSNVWRGDSPLSSATTDARQTAQSGDSNTADSLPV